MSIGLLFWILMIVSFVFSAWTTWPAGWRGAGPSLLVYVLLFLLGWAQFGAPLHG